MAFPFPQTRRRRSAYGRSAYGRRQQPRAAYGQRGRGLPIRLLIGLAIIGFSLVSYYFNTDVNAITGEKQRVALDSEEEEMRIGFQAAPEMAAQHGGAVEGRGAQMVRSVGNRLVDALEEQLAAEGKQNPYRFEFTLLADPKTVNAFALPGGPVFITRALFERLQTEGQLAGVLGHEIGHVLSRHGNQRMAQQKRDAGIASGVGVASGSMHTAQMVQQAINVASMKHGRDQELESDRWGVILMPLAGYDPSSLIGVMTILEDASGGKAPPEFMSTHPNPGNRREKIKEEIARRYPQGLPSNLEP